MKIKDWLYLFSQGESPNSNNSWWLDCSPEPVLIDCPPVNTNTIRELRNLGEGKSPRIILTSRQGHGRVSELQSALGWPVTLQEQEAYLLPSLNRVETFEEEHSTKSGLRLLWTPGVTPGSCVVHSPEPWNVLFCGRLLIPVASDRFSSVQTKSTFHWTMQQKSLKKLKDWVGCKPFPSLASGGALLGEDSRFIHPWNAWN